MPSVQTLFLAAGRGWLCAPARRTAVKAHTAAARIDNVARAPARLISVFHHTAPGPVAPLRETEDNQVLNYFKGVTMQADERTDRRCTRRRVLHAGAGALAAAGASPLLTRAALWAAAPDRETTDDPPFRTPSEPANSPIGVGQGIHPGRVAWVHEPKAATWDGKTGNWWDDGNTTPRRRTVWYPRACGRSPVSGTTKRPGRPCSSSFITAASCPAPDTGPERRSPSS